MVRNERQFNVTKGQISKLETALALSADAKGRMDAKVYRAMMAGIRSQIRDLSRELEEYERLKGLTALRMRSRDEFPEILIKARVARGYTQKELAKKLNIKPQQVQKYETTGYRSASFDRVLRVMEALDIEIDANIRLS